MFANPQIWWVMAVGLVAVAGVFLLAVLIGDRSRGRLRCPRCWYSMEGAGPREPRGATPTALPVCPECGHRPGSPRELRRTRRRWRAAALAPVLLVAAYFSFAAPRIARAGWIGALPSIVLSHRFDADAQLMRRPLDGWITPMGKELAAREAEGGLDRWSLGVIVRRSLEAHEKRFPHVVSIRSPVPPGVSVRVELVPLPLMAMRKDSELIVTDVSDPTRRAGGILAPPWTEDRYNGVLIFPPREPGKHQVTVDMELRHRGRRIWRERRTLDFEVATPETSPVKFLVSPEIDAAVAQHARPRLIFAEQGTPPVLEMHNLAPIRRKFNMAIGLRLELLRDGRVVAEGPVRRSNRQRTQGDPPAVVQHEMNWSEPPTSSEGSWSLRIIGDPDLGYRAYEPRAWVGSVTLPVQIDQQPTPAGE